MKKIDFQIILSLKDSVSNGLKQINSKFKEYQSSAEKGTSLTKKFGDVCNKLKWQNLDAAISVFERYSAAVSQATSTGVKFEQSIADLSSITGITAGELAELEKQARKVGVEGGVGAAEASKAYAILASQIDVAVIGIKGLNTLQEKTVVLAQAAGMTLEESANALAGTINQFSLSADQAGRVANVLAAGSKYGAASIQELSQSFKIVGSAASAMGLNVESTAGALEVLSKANLKGSEAGTSLRNIILKLNTELGVDLSKTSLSSALDALSPKLQDASYLAKLFGMENVAAAQFLIKNASAVGEMTQKVTDTNVAQEQAAIRTETTAHKMEVLKAKIDDYKISLTNMLGENTVWISALSEWAPAGLMAMQAVQGLGGAVSWLGKQKAVQTLITNTATKATSAYKVVQAALNVVMAANPVGLVVTAVVALAAALVYAYNNCEGFRKVVDQSWEAIKRFGIAIYDHVVKRVSAMIDGFKNVGIVIKKIFEGDFAGAVTAAKAATVDFAKAATGVDFSKQVDKTNKSLANTKSVLDGASEKVTFFGKTLTDNLNGDKQFDMTIVKTEIVKVKKIEDPISVVSVDKVEEADNKDKDIVKTGGLINNLKKQIEELESLKTFAATVSEISNINTELDILSQKLKSLETFKIKGEIEIPEVGKIENPFEDYFNTKTNDNFAAQIQKNDKELKIHGETLRENDRELKQGEENQLTYTEKVNMVTGAMGNLGNAVGGVAGEWINYGANVVSVIMTQMIPPLIQMIGVNKANAVSGAIAGAAPLPPPWNAIQLGVSIAAVLASFASIPAFANGGIVYGDTIARVGEYSGASSNPEVIAPLSRLRQLLGTSSGGFGGRVEFVISGRNLRAILDKNNHISNRTKA